MKKIALLMICMMVIPVLASADLTIKEKTYVRAFMGVWASEGDEVTYIKGDKMRSESVTEKTGVAAQRGLRNPPPAVTIIRLDKNVIWHVNLKDKTYMETALNPVPAAGDKPVYNYALKDVVVENTPDTREVMGIKCDGVKAVITFENDSNEGTITQVVNVEFWMTDKVKSLQQMREFWENMIEINQGQRERIPLGDAMTELWDKIGEGGKVPLAMEMSLDSSSMDPEEKAQMRASLEAMADMMEEKTGQKKELLGDEDDTAMLMNREIVSISEEKLDDSLFEIPEGFRKAAAIRMW